MPILKFGLSGLLFYFSFPNAVFVHGIPFAIFLFLVPVWHSFDGAFWIQRVQRGLLWGVLCYALLINWLCPANGLGYILFTLILAGQPVLFVLGMRWAPLRGGGRILCAAVLWTVTEWIRTQMMGGFGWTIGHALSEYPALIQIADVTGAYGISFAVIVVNGCVAETLRVRRRRYILVALGLLGALVLYSFWGELRAGRDPAASSVDTVCVIQPNISTVDKMDPALIDDVVDRHVVLSKQCAAAGPVSLIAWPETAVTDDIIRNTHLRAKVADLARSVDRPILIGSALLEDGRDKNAAVLMSPAGDIDGVYRKQKLVPLSEFDPFPAWLVEHFIRNHPDFWPGSTDALLTMNSAQAGTRKFAVRICSEDGYPELFRKLSGGPAAFVLVLLNDAWFPHPAALWMHSKNAVMQAAAFKMPILRVSNSGVSCRMDAFGRGCTGAEALPVDAATFARWSIPPQGPATFYSRYGDAFAGFCLLLFPFFFWRHRKHASAVQDSNSS